MCPDPELLSVYVDGEVPSPWSEKIEAHLAACPACAKKVANYRAQSGALRSEDEASGAMEAAKARVWSRLEGMEYAKKPRIVAWNRPITLPLPAAIAAALAIALVSVILLRAQNPAKPAVLTEVTSQAQPAIPVSSISDVLDYLDARDTGGNIIILKLPDSRSFQSVGNPEILREADYTRGRTQP